MRQRRLWLCILIFFTSLTLEVSAREYKIIGEIKDETYLKFKRELERTEKKPIARVILDSSGGAFFPAMAIGQLIHEHGLDVEVRKLCASACANYLFLAGKTKYLNRRSLLIYHGGMQQDNLFQQLDRMVRYSRNEVGKKDFEGFVVRKAIHPEIANDLGVEDLFKQREPAHIHRDLIRLEERYFSRIAIDPLITVYGQRGNYYAIYNSKMFKGFYYDLESLSHFGVTDIRVKGAKWRPWKGDKNKEFYPVSVKVY